MAQETYKGDVLQKIAGIGLIVGAVLTAVFNVLYPRADDPSDVSQVLTELADNETLSLIVFLALVPSAQTCDPVPSRPGGRVEGVCGTRRSNKTGVLYSVQSNPYLVHTSNIVSTEKKRKEKGKEKNGLTEA